MDKIIQSNSQLVDIISGFVISTGYLFLIKVVKPILTFLNINYDINTIEEHILFILGAVLIVLFVFLLSKLRSIEFERKRYVKRTRRKKPVEIMKERDLKVARQFEEKELKMIDAMNYEQFTEYLVQVFQSQGMAKVEFEGHEADIFDVIVKNREGEYAALAIYQKSIEEEDILFINEHKDKSRTNIIIMITNKEVDKKSRRIAKKADIAIMGRPELIDILKDMVFNPLD